MPNLNKVMLMGNLTRDPELRYTPSNMAVANLSLAVNRVWYNKQTNEKQEEVTFVDVDVFGRQAEVIAKYMSKGRPILVEGRLKLDSWESKEGDKRSKLKVVLENFQFVGSRGDSGGDSGGGSSSHEDSAPPPRAAQRGNASAASPASVDEEDVPF